ncbi:hypothetical protein ACJMK2_014645 [Sinanodonta woodiana]|uniref:Uncharacterized protein n=1 Tax=Sinanodonta woodiana TaxID=1069815 RepID=A0ABD3V1B8_SINWO
MPIDVHIWEFKGFFESWGHASMTLSDGTHISWWPRGGAEGKSVKGNAVKAPPVRCMTLADDIQCENNDQPNTLTIRDFIIEEDPIKTWWQSFRKYENWRAFDQNCSTVVYKALCAGFALRYFETADKTNKYEATAIWTPNKVKEFVEHLIKRISIPSAETTGSNQGSGKKTSCSYI